MSVHPQGPQSDGLRICFQESSTSAEFSVDRTRHLMSFLTMMWPQPRLERGPVRRGSVHQRVWLGPEGGAGPDSLMRAPTAG